MNRSLSPEEATSARRLWSAAGFAGGFEAAPLPGGANNRVYRLSGGGQSALLKGYYTGADDPRDRFGAEVAFTRFLHHHRVTAAPRPLAWDREAGMALFEFIEGRRLTAGEVTAAHVRSALEFVLEINEHRNSPQAGPLPNASEACFSIAEHLLCVERRVERLGGIGNATAIDGDIRRFIQSDLKPAWIRIRDRTRQAQDAQGVDNHLLPPQERCLSPSDFGFHNAIHDVAGKLRFIDFEYAGWDDPAKLVCDFFCQVEVPAPPDFLRDFAAGAATTSTRPAETFRRSELLLPVYRIKWCCILLNAAVPDQANRRRFSRGEEGVERKAAQLAKSRDLWKELMDEL